MDSKLAETPRPWRPMSLRHVGDVGLVMDRKSGKRHDSDSFIRRHKRHHEDD